MLKKHLLLLLSMLKTVHILLHILVETVIIFMSGFLMNRKLNIIYLVLCNTLNDIPKIKHWMNVCDFFCSGTLSERGLVRHEDTQKILSLADQQQGFSRSPDAVYDPPPPVMRVLELSGLENRPVRCLQKPTCWRGDADSTRDVQPVTRQGRWC